MDLIKIGKFIASKRKEKGYTQLELATILNVSEKTISKWECGKGFPDTSLILPLCQQLNITANELLSGCTLTESEYKQTAENNLISLINEKTESKKKIIISCITGLVGTLVLFASMLLIKLVSLALSVKIAIATIGIVVFLLCLGVSCFTDKDAGYFECPHCKTRFKPSTKAYLMGAHTITRRQLKCPNCNKTSYCRHRLTK